MIHTAYKITIWFGLWCQLLCSWECPDFGPGLDSHHLVNI